jgi:predicted CXXCH cytochrome family protein
MMPTRSIANAPLRRWRKTVLWVGGTIALVALIAAAGCTPEKKYKILSVFFDGVPNPNAPPGSAEVSEFGPTGPAPKPVGVTHKPFADAMNDSTKCNVCHTGGTGSFESFQKISSDVCLKCHQKVLTQFKVMHGPVVSVECLLCHTPHESSLPGLLNVAPPALCTQCHQRDLLSAKPPDHLLPDSQCLKCHVGHGGPQHGFLRPTTRPALVAPARGVKS